MKSLFDSVGIKTHFGAKEIELLYSKWKNQSTSGEVDKATFSYGLQAIGITDPLIIEEYFSAFDSDKNGTINFLEFVTGLSVVQRGSLEERLQFMFKAYDTDGNGVLSPDEIYNLLKATTRSKGQFLTHGQLLEMVTNCFKEVDINHDGEISFDEFRAAVQSQKLVVDCFVNLTF